LVGEWVSVWYQLSLSNWDWIIGSLTDWIKDRVTVNWYLSVWFRA
jgi:hypothetical protein